MTDLFKQKIKDFIVNNELEESLNSEGSALNGACVAIAGYSLYLDCYILPGDVTDYLCSELINHIQTIFKVSSGFEAEFERVFEYAEDNSYENWWTLESNREAFVVDLKI